MVGGLFLDIMAHAAGAVETFFTPWHGLFYSGALASGLWIIWPLVGALREGRPLLKALPGGYELGLPGFALVSAGGLLDMGWHALFGIETGPLLLISVPHIVLGAGLFLMTLCPFRAIWTTYGPDDAPSLRRLLPALLSLALTTTIVCMLALPVWGFSFATFVPQGRLDLLLARLGTTASAPGIRRLTDLLIERQLGKMAVTTLILLAPTLLVLRRWRIPRGGVAVLIGVPMILASSTLNSALIMVPQAVITVLAAEGLVRLWGPSPRRPMSLRFFATTLPMVIWGLDFAVTQAITGVSWPLSLVLGSVLYSGVVGGLFSLFAVPTPLPQA
jgi:hypothetical protein